MLQSKTSTEIENENFLILKFQCRTAVVWSPSSVYSGVCACCALRLLPVARCGRFRWVWRHCGCRLPSRCHNTDHPRPPGRPLCRLGGSRAAADGAHGLRALVAARGLASGGRSDCPTRADERRPVIGRRTRAPLQNSQ